MSRLALAFSCLLLLPACSGDDASDGSAGSAGTGSTTDGCPRGIGSSGQCPATDTVTDSAGTITASGGSTTATSNTTGPTTSNTTGPSTGMTDTASTSGTSATTGMTGMTATDTGSGCEAGCDVESTMMVTLDMCSHEEFVDLGPMETVKITVVGDQITIEILGNPGLAPVVGTIDMAGAFAAMGMGTVAGFSDIAISWTGTFVGGVLSATLELGGDGQLPGGCPILFSVMG